MGDFTWHVSDPGYRPISLASNQNPGPVWMLGPDGQKWRENEYDGYGSFGGKDAHEALEEWNEMSTGPSRPRFAPDGVEMGLRPWGDHWFPKALKFPLKFSFNPDAQYDDLPAALPAAQMSDAIGIYDFKVTLTNGDVLETKSELEHFWAIVHAAMQNLVFDAEQQEELAERHMEFMLKNLDKSEAYVLAMGHKMEYIGWIRSAHGVLRDMLGMDRTIRVSHMLTNRISDKNLAQFSESYDEGLTQGHQDYRDVSSKQLERYRNGLPIELDQSLSSSGLQARLFAAEANGTEDAGLAYDLGRNIGASRESRAAYLGPDISLNKENPFAQEIERRARRETR